MFNVVKKILLSLGLASILFGCRSEFGYKKNDGKRPGGESASFSIAADKTTVYLNGQSNNAVYLSANCLNNGNVNTISWDLGDGNTATGQEISHSYNQIGAYSVKAYCRGAQLLTDTVRISVTYQNSSGNPGNPGNPTQYPSKGNGNMDGTGWLDWILGSNK
jgi:PKD repeat protein